MDKTKFKIEYQNLSALEFSGEVEIDPDVFDFAIGDPDIFTDPRITKYAMEKALEGDTHYGTPSGKKELKERIVKFHNERLGQNINEMNVQVTSSATHAMFLVLKALLNHGDEVICFAPYFANYTSQVLLNGGVPVIVHTHYSDGFEIMENELRAKISDKTKAIIFNNPCNPTGRLYSEETIAMLARVAKEKDLIVICDDIYTTFVYGDREFRSISSYPGMFSRCIQVRSFSKDTIMTGWRIGYIVADRELVNLTKIINENVVYAPSVICQNAAIRALDLFDDISMQVQALYSKRLNKVYECIKKSRYFDCLPISGTFYVFMNIEKTGMEATEFCEFALKEAKVKMFAGNLFGGNEYNHFVRLAINMDVEKIEEAFARLEALPYPGEAK
ncbi:MAG: aminotransferase class I/II-fold pyridoxal phosphate-dependent enzyme [Bacilli bacterium]|nr:aminotransferase class I/II-fold pyridoxal phosphate-dependent enzyme [Bacilli bacterium]